MRLELKKKKVPKHGRF